VLCSLIRVEENSNIIHLGRRELDIFIMSSCQDCQGCNNVVIPTTATKADAKSPLPAQTLAPKRIEAYHPIMDHLNQYCYNPVQQAIKHAATKPCVAWPSAFQLLLSDTKGNMVEYVACRPILTNGDPYCQHTSISPHLFVNSAYKHTSRGPYWMAHLDARHLKRKGKAVRSAS